mmetsp:Transcript_997/g.3882  ORF Transcript_997/g.3882 Transcript_997/m.3882 type:complete len:390 (-) Transcript_997:1008-2177(-)
MGAELLSTMMSSEISTAPSNTAASAAVVREISDQGWSNAPIGAGITNDAKCADSTLRIIQRASSDMQCSCAPAPTPAAPVLRAPPAENADVTHSSALPRVAASTHFSRLGNGPANGSGSCSIRCSTHAHPKQTTARAWGGACAPVRTAASQTASAIMSTTSVTARQVLAAPAPASTFRSQVPVCSSPMRDMRESKPISCNDRHAASASRRSVYARASPSAAASAAAAAVWLVRLSMFVSTPKTWAPSVSSISCRLSWPVSPTAYTISSNWHCSRSAARAQSAAAFTPAVTPRERRLPAMAAIARAAGGPPSAAFSADAKFASRPAERAFATASAHASQAARFSAAALWWASPSRPSSSATSAAASVMSVRIFASCNTLNIAKSRSLRSV